ncbi:M3 family metallopeptidase [Leptospira sp. severe_002]|uniref:M3 family metallopeptidase n=1 Tax=Leptospira sp. severe_002 TaxID=2838237 RepID=UPI001E64342D|nr:M3 family metallopeptidase [Leptospira sp. severe_002]
MNDKTAAAATGGDNPFFKDWTGPFGVPEFSRVKSEHFVPAYERAFAEHMAEVEAIANDPAPPTFENTILAYEEAGRMLQRVDDVFHNLVGTDSTDELLKIEADISPVSASHWNKIRMNEALFRRIDALYQKRDSLGLTSEQVRVLERHHTSFRRGGAALDVEKKKKLAEVTERLAALGTSFSQNVLADEQSYALELAEVDLAGLPDFVRDAARAAAEERGKPGKYVVTLQRSSVEPFLQFSSRRDLREKVFRAFLARGDKNDATDNKAIIAETIRLRIERAKLLDYKSFARYRLDDAMAKTPEAVRGLLEKVWKPARERALADRDDLQKLIQEEGGNFKLAAWDWRYYAEKLRKRRCNIEESEVKPYMQLDNVIEAAFYTANRLFGLVFKRVDVPVWHPDVRAWEVTREGKHVGLFFGDYFARPSKQSGAWMSTLRDQEDMHGQVRPLVLNVMNFNKGDPTLLSFEDARTLFHEMGHAMHGLLSNVKYHSVSCTSVLTDWVELPSQLYEHWFERPEVLRKFAKHYVTGEPMPEELLKRLIAARNFNRGCETLEYISSALVDLELHQLESAEGLDVNKFERDTLARIGMPEEIAMRHRTPHFGHVFSGGYYASAYYSYMWSEVLDSDAFHAFEETGDVFDPSVAKKLYDNVLSTGGSRDPAELYVAFRGRLPSADALLKKRGFIDEAA